MHLSVSRTFCAAVLAAGALTASRAGAEAPPPAPAISLAKQLSFTPQSGTAWYVDGSDDGATWSELAGPFFANGGPVDHFLPAGNGSRHFQLRYVDPATVGHAPVTVAGTSLLMDKDGEVVEVIFMNEVGGILRIDTQHARSFTYTWLKKSPDEGEAILSGVDGTFTLLRLKFMDGQLGRWGMEDIPSAQAARLIKDTLDAGAFTFRKGRFRRAPRHAELPSDFAGRSMVLSEAGRLTHLNFTGATTVIMKTEGGASCEGKYAWDPTDAAHGNLQIVPLTGSALDLSLNLPAPGSGRFEGTLPDGGSGTRSGTFTLPEDQAPPADEDCPPEDLSGRSYIFSGSPVCTMAFNGNGTGVKTKDTGGALETSQFTYSYSRTGGKSAGLTVTCPGAGNDLIDDFDLEFNEDCNGKFERKSYSGGGPRTSDANGASSLGTVSRG